MGDIIPFRDMRASRNPAAELGGDANISLADTAELARTVRKLGLAAVGLCQSVCDGLNRFGAAFDDALRVNEAHSRLQTEIIAAMHMVATDPEQAANRLHDLRADYARLSNPVTTTLAPHRVST